MADWTPQDEQEYQLIKLQIQGLSPKVREIGKQSYEEYLKEAGKLQPQDPTQEAEIAGEGVTDMWYDPIDLLGGNLAGVARGGISGGVAKKAIQKGEQGISRLLGTTAQMTGRDLQTYLANPKAVEAMRKAAPEAIQDQLNVKIKQGVEGLIAKNQGLKNKVLEELPQKTINVNVQQFKSASPEVQNELQRIIVAQNPPKIIKTGIIDNTGKEVIQEVAPKIPNKLNLTARQAQVLKEKAQESAKFKPGAIVDPISHEAKRKADAEIASNLRKGIEGVAPEVSPLNKEIARTTRYSKAAQRMSNNPAAIAGSGLKARAISNVLENEGGAKGLSSLTNQYLATKSKSFEPEGLISDTIKGVSRFGIRATKGASDIAQKAVGGVEKVLQTPVSKALTSGAITGAITKQADPLSAFLNPPQEPSWSEQDEQEYQTLKSQIMQLQGK